MATIVNLEVAVFKSKCSSRLRQKSEKAQRVTGLNGCNWPKKTMRNTTKHVNNNPYLSGITQRTLSKGHNDQHLLLTC